MQESGYAAATKQQAVDILTLQKKLDLAAGKQKIREMQLKVEAMEKEERAQEEAIRKQAPTEQQDDSEQENAEQKDAEQKTQSPSKQKRTEIEVRIIPEAGEDLTITIDTQDVTPHQGKRATLMDLTKHLYELECFAADYGIDLVQAGLEGQVVEKPVYVDATFEGKEEWTTTVGKRPDANTRKIDQMHGGTLQLTPRIASKPKASHPKWLTAQIGSGPSPSPVKVSNSDPNMISGRSMREQGKDQQRERTDSKRSTSWRWKTTQTTTPRTSKNWGSTQKRERQNHSRNRTQSQRTQAKKRPQPRSHPRTQPAQRRKTRNPKQARKTQEEGNRADQTKRTGQAVMTEKERDPKNDETEKNTNNNKHPNNLDNIKQLDKIKQLENIKQLNRNTLSKYIHLLSKANRNRIQKPGARTESDGHLAAGAGNKYKT